MEGLPTAPKTLPTEMGDLLRRLAELWAQEGVRPRPVSAVVTHWDDLIEQWSVDPSLPLFIRKSASNRGAVIHHRTDREIIPTDNSPAQWAFTMAVLGKRPSLKDIRDMLKQDQIPIAMVLTAVEKASARYRRTLSKSDNPNPENSRSLKTQRPPCDRKCLPEQLSEHRRLSLDELYHATVCTLP